jgi:ABC-type glycerol-3-phosphate transport system substrate-binding protein
MPQHGMARADRIGNTTLTRRALLAGGAAFGAGACTPRPPADALRFWAMSYQGDYAPHLMLPFTAATGIAVDTQSLAWTAAHEKLLTAHVGGALPDVFMLPNGWVQEFATIGALAPVPSAALFDGIFPGALAAMKVGARHYAVPWSVAPQVQFWRRDLLGQVGWDAAPETWDGWRRMGLALKRRRPDEFVFMMLLNWPDALLTMLTQAGAAWLRDRNTRGNFRSGKAREAFGYYKSLFDDALAPKVLSTEVPDALAAFNQGLFAVWTTGPTTLFDMASTLPFKQRPDRLPLDRWGTARIPGPDGPGAISVRDVCVCVSARSRRPDEAWALVRHLTHAASELRYANLIGSLPALRSAWGGLDFPADKLAAFRAQIDHVDAPPMIIESEQIRDQIALYSERMVRGLLTVDQTLAALDERVDRILAKRRQLVDAGKIT